jgi:hypothetical protein
MYSASVFCPLMWSAIVGVGRMPGLAAPKAVPADTRSWAITALALPTALDTGAGRVADGAGPTWPSSWVHRA